MIFDYDKEMREERRISLLTDDYLAELIKKKKLKDEVTNRVTY